MFVSLFFKLKPKMNQIKRCCRFRSLLFSLSFFFVVLFSYVKLHAQNFGDNNPVWNYNVTSGWGGQRYHLKLSIKKDTIFNGKKCKILTPGKSGIPNYMPYKNMICQDSGKVVFWSPSMQEFQILYDFKAKKGTYWKAKLDGYKLIANSEIFHFLVDSTYISSINGKSLSVQSIRIGVDSSDLHSEIFPSYMTETVIESIGYTKFLFPWDYGPLDDDFVNGIRCFEDDSIGFYRFDYSVACNYTQVSIDQLNEAENFSVFPNPSKGLFYLEGITANITAISIVDLAGNSVGLTCDLNSENEPKTVELQKVQQGIYFVEIATKADQIIRRKVVVQ